MCRGGTFPQVATGDLDITVLGQLTLTDLAFGDTLQSRSLQIISLDAPLGGRPIRQQALEGTARYANDPSIFPDPHPELDSFPLGIPPDIVRKGEEHHSASALTDFVLVMFVECIGLARDARSRWADDAT
jgi:hypothetical protein